MKFLLDAHFPKRIKAVFYKHGYEAIHTLDLPNKNMTTDNEVLQIAAEKNYVVVSKDADFVDAFYLRNKPKRLLLVSTGNIRNDELSALLHQNIEAVESALNEHRFVELNRTQIIVHV